MLESETDRAFVAAARRVVVLADHTKWGTFGISTIAGLEEADELISDEGLPGEARRILGERVGRLRIAGSGGTEARRHGQGSRYRTVRPDPRRRLGTTEK